MEVKKIFINRRQRPFCPPERPPQDGDPIPPPSNRRKHFNRFIVKKGDGDGDNELKSF